MYPFLIALFVLAIPAVALAQPADIPRLPIGGVYHIKSQVGPELDIVQLCCVRSDASPVEELGCNPAAANEVVEFDVTVTATPGADAEVRCYVEDSSGLVSDYSPNAYLLDFTPPNAPLLVP
jgi:hypothetical protein